jgi:hypothetical protein
MIRLSPPNYGFVQVERGVLTDAKPFLAKVQAIGDLALGREIVGSMTEFGMEMASDDESMPELMYSEMPVRTPFLEVAGSNDLALVLLHRGVPADLVSRYGILRARRILDRTYVKRRHDVISASGKKERAEIREPGLLTILDEVSEKYEAEPHETSFVFDRVDVIGEPGSNFVLGLMPSPARAATRVSHEQAKAAARYLSRENSRLTRPATPWQIAIPFARFPASVPNHKYERLLEGLNGLPSVRFTLGPPRVTSS